MRKYVQLSFMGLFLLTGACEYENEESLFAQQGECSTPVVFTTHIAPIIQTNCAISGCHVAGGIPPELTSYEKVKARATGVQHQTLSRQMPPPYSGLNLSEEDLELIKCWVKQGSPRE